MKDGFQTGVDILTDIPEAWPRPTREDGTGARTIRSCFALLWGTNLCWKDISGLAHITCIVDVAVMYHSHRSSQHFLITFVLLGKNVRFYYLG